MRIALVGKMCSGKTYLADILIKKYKLSKFSFGDKVKDVAKDLFLMENKDRKLIQSVADCLKIIDKDVWANYLIRQISDLDNIIIDDLRFQNEAIKLKKLGFIIIHLKLDKNTQINRLKQKYSNFENHLNNLFHNSETEHNLIDADYYVDSNNNTKFCVINYLESL